MLRPMPKPQPPAPPVTGIHPDPERMDGLASLADEITAMAAHLAAGTCHLLELIAVFDEEGGWHGTARASAPRQLLLRCSTSCVPAVVCTMAGVEMRHEYLHRP